MTKKEKIIITSSTILLVLVLLIGVSYAYYVAKITGNETSGTLSGTSSKLELTYADGVDTVTASNIAPGWSATKTFTVTNTGNDTATYKLRLYDVSNGFIYNGIQIKYSSSDGGKTIDNIPLESSDKTVSEAVTIAKNTTHTYTFTTSYVNLSSDQVADLGKSFSFKIGIEAASNSVIAEKGNAAESIKKLGGLTSGNGGIEIINQPATTQLAATTEYRYYGSNPNNYVRFNDELWRIIGVFETADSTGNLNYRVKLIRNDLLGSFSWDYKQSGVGSSTTIGGSNDWSDSQLMMMLNSNKYLKSGYDKNGTLLHQGYSITDGNVSDGTRTIFKNMGSYLDSALEAYKPASTPTTGYTGSTMTLPRLSTTAQTMIDEITYYLGGSNTNSITSSEYYNRERSTTVYSNRPVKWIGQIGLMYMSDYGYAADPSLCARTQKLYYNAADGYFGTAACHINNWLWKSGQVQWTLVPNSSYSSNVAYVDSTGYANYNFAYYGYAGRPVLYLKSDIRITGGLGTSSNPYTLG